MSDEKKDRGLEKGLTSYGDRGFSLFLRKAFIKGAGYTDDALSRCACATQSAPVSPPPTTITCLPAALIAPPPVPAIERARS